MHRERHVLRFATGEVRVEIAEGDAATELRHRAQSAALLSSASVRITAPATSPDR